MLLRYVPQQHIDVTRLGMTQTKFSCILRGTLLHTAPKSHPALTGNDPVSHRDGEADPAPEALRELRLGRAHRILIHGVPASQHHHLQTRRNFMTLKHAYCFWVEVSYQA